MAKKVPPPKLFVGFQDESGQMVIPPKYESTNHFKGGYAPVSVGGKATLINLKGEPVLPLLYSIVKHPQNGLVAVQKDGKWGVIALDGKVILPIESKEIVFIGSDEITVKNFDNDYDAYDRTGRLLRKNVSFDDSQKVQPESELKKDALKAVFIENKAHGEFLSAEESPAVIKELLEKYWERFEKAKEKDQPKVIKAIEALIEKGLEEDAECVEFELFLEEGWPAVPHGFKTDKEITLKAIAALPGLFKDSPRTRAGVEAAGDAVKELIERAMVFVADCWKAAGGTRLKVKGYIHLDRDNRWLDMDTKKKVEDGDMSFVNKFMGKG